MRRQYSIPLSITFLTITLLCFNNCGKFLADFSKSNGSTIMGNPMTPLAVAQYTAVGNVTLCANRLTLKTTGGADVSINFHATQENIIPFEGLDLEALPIPQGSYSQVRLELYDSCSSGRSLGVVNSQGSFNSTQAITLTFSGQVNIDAAPKKITLYMQPIANDLATVNSNNEVPVKATISSGASSNSSTWYPTALANAPLARADHASIWTGSEMMVWGGNDGVSPSLNSGGRYNPITDSWTATNVVSAPSGRAGGEASWTGSEVIIWGGYDGTTYLADGGRYNPATDTWSAVTTTGAPSPRTEFGAVYTGTEMIVWGGRQNVTLLNTGGRYNPATDAWAATNTVNAPSTRHHVTPVWTGSKMLVWDGDSGDNTGAQYDPSSNTWAAITTSGAPNAGPLVNPCVIWSGSEMIVWGGRDSTSSLFNLGARYNPISDTWIALPTVNAPSPRQSATCAWTGHQLIVWGGATNYAETVYTGTGGIYDLGSNSWNSVDTTNAPTARTTEGIWAGYEMLLWGGSVNSGVTNSGARFVP